MALQQSRQARKYTIPGAEERDRPEHLVLTIDCQSYGYRNYNENLEGKDPEPQARHLVKPRNAKNRLPSMRHWDQPLCFSLVRAIEARSALTERSSTPSRSITRRTSGDASSSSKVSSRDGIRSCVGPQLDGLSSVAEQG